VSLRGCMSKIRESRGDRQLEVNAPYLSHPGDLCRVTGDGMLVEFASAVDAVTFAVGTRAARCLRFVRLILPATAASLFGNGGQAIEIARGYFEPFFQMRFEIVK
jgi:class 3 adenylate cyclase